MLERHLAWEKRNFDADGDGLYDAYAASGPAMPCNTAAEALRIHRLIITAQQNSGRTGDIVRQNRSLISRKPEILKAMNKQLWIPPTDLYAEYKDRWADSYCIRQQAYGPSIMPSTEKFPILSKAGNARYVDHNIPHIPVRVKGLHDTTSYLLSTTNWQPYTWSLNNVVLAENLNIALAYWQGGDPKKLTGLEKRPGGKHVPGISPGNF